MTNKRIKNIIIACISLLCIAVIVTISFAAWDVKSGENQFAASAGKRVKVSVENDTTFNKTLYPDGYQPLDANGSLAPSDRSNIFIYAAFTPNYLDKDNNATTDDSYIKNTKLRWKYTELKVGNTSILDSTTNNVASASVFDAWVAKSATYVKPDANYLVEPISGELSQGLTYYFVIRFKTLTVKTYLHSGTTYYFYSDGTYKTSNTAIKNIINEANLGAEGMPFVNNVYDYANAPYTTEANDNETYLKYANQSISVKIEIYADGGNKA